MTGEVFASSAVTHIILDDDRTGPCTVLRHCILGSQAQPPLPEKHWHRGTIPYSPFIRKSARLAGLSPLHPLENAKNILPNLLPMTHAPFNSADPRSKFFSDRYFGGRIVP